MWGLSRPVVFAVGKVGRDEGILELGVLAMVKPVHTRESLRSKLWFYMFMFRFPKVLHVHVQV